jgi:AcrR family transcriptional regulator
MRSAPRSGIHSARPLRADAARNRERILAAAAELFAARGLEVTLDDIAGHAGLGVGTVYRRFPNRDALIEALFEERLAGIVAVAEAALAEPDSWAGLCRLFEELGAVMAADQGLHEVLVCRAGGCGQNDVVRDRMAPVVGAVFARAAADGHLRPDVVPTDFPMVLRMVAAIAEFTRDVRPELWRRYVALLLDGLAVSRDAPSPLPEGPLQSAELDAAKATWRASHY